MLLSWQQTRKVFSMWITRSLTDTGRYCSFVLMWVSPNCAYVLFCTSRLFVSLPYSICSQTWPSTHIYTVTPCLCCSLIYASSFFCASNFSNSSSVHWKYCMAYPACGVHVWCLCALTRFLLKVEQSTLQCCQYFIWLFFSCVTRTTIYCSDLST